MSLSPLSSSGVRSLSLAPLTLDPVTPTPVATSVTIKKPQPFLGRDVFQIGEIVASCTPLNEDLATLVAEYVGGSQSFSERVKLRLTEHVFLSTPLNEDVATLVAEYVKGDENAFGAKEWQEYYGVDVGPELPFSKDLIDWWLDTDPLEPSKSIYDTHVPPVLRPQSITNIKTKTKEDFNLKALEKIVAAPKKGNPGHFHEMSRMISPALSEHENTPAGPTCLLVMRKGLLFPNNSDETYDDAAYAKQKDALKALNAKIKPGRGYISETSALDLATIIFTRYTATKEILFQRGSPAEEILFRQERRAGRKGPRPTLGVCKEKSRFPDQPVGLPAFHVCVGGFNPSRGLNIGIFMHSKADVGTVAMRKFTVASRK